MQKKNEEARKQIQAGRVTIAGQTETLSQADKEQVHICLDTHPTKLSKAFGMNSQCGCRQSY